MALLIGAFHKNQNSMVYPEALNAPEPTRTRTNTSSNPSGLEQLQYSFAFVKMLAHGDGGVPRLQRVTQSSHKISVLVPVYSSPSRWLSPTSPTDNRQLSCSIDGVGLSAHYDGGRKPDIHCGLAFCIRWQAASHSISC